jgi:WD40 repeat protein
LIRAALTLAAPALARDSSELAPQLLARLAPEDAAGFGEFLTRTHRVLSGCTLVPRRPTFTPPGAELRRFEGHGDRVTSVTVLADGRRALSGSWDQTLRLWDLETGAELARLTFDAVTSALTWSHRRGRAVVGDDRGRVHVVDLIE